MIMGIIILRKRYEPSKYISVLMITLGIIICTIISGSSVVRALIYLDFYRCMLQHRRLQNIVAIIFILVDIPSRRVQLIQTW